MRTLTRHVATVMTAALVVHSLSPPATVLAAADAQPTLTATGADDDQHQDAALSAVCAQVPAAPFVDRDAAGVHVGAVDCVADWAIASGRADGRFDPTATVTRGQMATFTLQLLLAVGVPLPAPERSFDDTADSVHRRAIERLATVGVLSGTGDGRFDPDAPVTRAQAATILVKAVDVGGAMLAAVNTASFPDVTAGPHQGPVVLAASSGLMTGYPDGTFRPGVAINRAQMASTLARTAGRWGPRSSSGSAGGVRRPAGRRGLSTQ